MNLFRLTTGNRPGRGLGWIAGLGALVLLGACTVGPSQREAPLTYDFGPLPPTQDTVAAKAEATLLLPSVTAPSWLDNTGVVYRLVYADPARPRVYANSRWSAPPPALLTQRLQTRFAGALDILTGPAPARADYALQLDLDDFSQSFEAPGSSTVKVRLRATLIHLPTRRLVAQQTFTQERHAMPNAEGAAKSLGEAGDAVVSSLLAWSQQHLNKEKK
jgi:cholesterol transport system auxiliary component